jgi:hypothetical protein
VVGGCAFSEKAVDFINEDDCWLQFMSKGEDRINESFALSKPLLGQRAHMEIYKSSTPKGNKSCLIRA